MKRSKQNVLKIVAASAVSLFSLASVVIATIAWFSFASRAQANGETFKVITNGSGYELGDVYLHKFNYEEKRVGNVTMIEYLTPETGEVKRYLYDKETYNQFGETVQDTWVPVSTMNVYDPIEFIIHSNASLRDLNCNAIYEINVLSDSLTNCYLSVDALRLTEKTKTDEQIFLTDCVDFDVYVEEDLVDKIDENTWNSNLYTNGGEPLYYPSYSNKLNRSLTDLEKIYYKISYLSSLTKQQFSSNDHAHFYVNQGEKQSTIPVTANRATAFSGQNAPRSMKIYVNVNYAISQLQKYATQIYNGNIHAIFDFAFSFKIVERATN